MLLTEFLAPERVLIPLAARDKAGVIAELTHHLTDQTGAAFAEVLGAVEEREAVQSTGIGFGVAIPHARSRAVRELTVVCGVSAVPVPYDSIDGEPVRLFFLIVAPESSAGQHIKVLSRIARLVRREDLRQQLCACATAQEFCSVVAEAETRV